MATPIIRITGSISGAGTPGVTRFVVAGETVTLTDTEPANAGASYQWTILSAPIGAGTVLTGATTSAPTFVAPTTAFAGSVRVRCLVDGIDQAVTIAAVALPTTGARIPAFQERDEWNAGGSAVGWHEAMTVFMRAADAALPKSLELIEVIDPVATTNSVTFSGLDGDTDGIYQLRMRWTMPTPSVARLVVRPNGLTVDQYSVWTSSNSAGTTQGSLDDFVGAVCEARAKQYFVLEFDARTGAGARQGTWYGGSVSGVAGATTHTIQGVSTWDDQGTGISSLVITAVNNLGAGLFNQISAASRFELYRIRGV